MSNPGGKAPILKFNGAKAQDNPTNQSYIIPQHLADILFRELGSKPAQLRVMLVLIGTKEGFAVSEKWICERANISQPTYSRVRKELEAAGWLSLEPGKSITINYDSIYKT